MNSISTEIRHSQNRAQDFADLEYRRKFMNLSDQDCASIRLIKDIIDRELPVALDSFYEQVRKTPETSSFFSSEGKIEQAMRPRRSKNWSKPPVGRFCLAFPLWKKPGMPLAQSYRAWQILAIT